MHWPSDSPVTMTLPMSPSEGVLPKRKDAMSPGLFKRKYLRKIFVPPLPHLLLDHESSVGARDHLEERVLTLPAQGHLLTPSDGEVLPTSAASSSVTCKRKEATSTGGIKRKYLRKVVVPPLPQLTVADPSSTSSDCHQQFIEQQEEPIPPDPLPHEPTTTPDGEALTMTLSPAVGDNKNKGATSPTKSHTKYLLQVSLPLLTLNGKCISVEHLAGSPSPFELSDQENQSASDLLLHQHTVTTTPQDEMVTMTTSSKSASSSPNVLRKKTRSFSPKMLKKEISKKLGVATGSHLTVTRRSGSPDSPVGSCGAEQQQHCQLMAQATTAPYSDASQGTQPKRKEVTSPKVLKKKYIDKVVRPLLPQLAVNGKCVSTESMDESPSAFEQELADQENQSPNDPEFVRRASQRWQRKTGTIHHQPFQGMMSQSGSLDMLLPIHCTKFEWPTSPSQQPAFQRRVSSTQPIYLSSSPFTSPPTPPISNSHFQRGSRQYCSMFTRPTVLEDSSFQRGSKQYTSMCARATGLDGQRAQRRYQQRSASLIPPPSATADGNEKSAEKKRKTSLQMLWVRRSSSCERQQQKTSSKTASARVRCRERLALDDSVAEEVRRAARREEPLQRLGSRIRKSLRVPKRSRSPSQNQALASLPSSASYQSGLSTFWDDSCSSPTGSTSSSPLYGLSSSSSMSSNFSWTSPPASPSLSTASREGLQHHVSFQDIFDAEPKIAEKFAIMFPTEPRPEWHRHLRDVLHKAGQKIFKKPEYHDTTIPENLRHQLKHIYVY